MISYYTEGVEMPPIQQSEITAWVKAVAGTYDKRVGEIAYIFCSDEKILEVNRQYLQHDYYTDTVRETALRATCSSVWTRYVPMPNSSRLLTRPNSTGSSSTASCTFAASTTKDRVNVKSWKQPKTKHSTC